MISHDCHSYLHVILTNGIPPCKALVMAGESATNDVDEEVYDNAGNERNEARKASAGDRRAIADADQAGQLDISGEAKTARALRTPEPPTDAARMAHNTTHVPFRDWCPICVASRGRSSPHRRVVVNKIADTLPKFQTDYMFIRTVAESKTQPCITFVEMCSGVVISFMCARKGGYEDLTKEILRHFEAYGFLNPVIIQCDKEMSIIDLCRKVARERNARTVLRFAPKTSHQSIGFVEAVHGHIQGLARCYQTQIETNTGVQLSAISPAIPFAIRYAGFVLSRFTVRPDGRTPFQYLLGTPYVSPLCMFGESVFALIPDHAVRADKLTNRWISGSDGGDASSDEHLVGTKHGLLKCRSFRRKPPGEQWSRRETIEARGTKWNFDVEMDSGIPGPTLEPRRDEGMPTGAAPMEIPTVPPPAPPPEEQVPEIRSQGVHAKALRIRAFWSEVGKTPGCAACETPGPGKSHTRECKTYQDAWEDSRRTASAEEARRGIVGDPDTRPLDPSSSSTDPNPKRSKTTSVTDNDSVSNQMDEDNFQRGPATSHQLESVHDQNVPKKARVARNVFGENGVKFDVNEEAWPKADLAIQATYEGALFDGLPANKVKARDEREIQQMKDLQLYSWVKETD